VYPYRSGTYHLTTGDAVTAMGADPPERHASSLIDSSSPEPRGSAPERQASMFRRIPANKQLEDDPSQVGGADQARFGTQLRGP
jgi:hypothetical protein